MSEAPTEPRNGLRERPTALPGRAAGQGWSGLADGAPLSLWQAGAVFAGVCAVCLLPVLLVRNPPLHDYPFHIARIFILAHWQASPALQEHYDVGTFLLPNVAQDVIAVWLAQLMPLELAGRVFIGITLALQLSGCAALHRVLHGRFSLWPMAAGLFLYNWIFLFGFLNYLFGIGAMLWAVAIWIGLAQRGAGAATRFLCGTALTLVLFFCHLIACGLFAVVVAGFEIGRAGPLWRRWSWRVAGDLALGAAIFLAPAVLFLASPTAGEAGRRTSHSLVNLLRTPPMFVRALMSGDYLVDAVTGLAILACAAILVRRGTLRVARPMLLPCALLAASFLVMPHELFGGWGADTRIPLVIVLVLIASVQPVLRDRRWSGALVAVLAGALLVQAGLRTRAWVAQDAVIEKIRDALAALPARSVLMVASEYDVPSFQDIDLRLWRPPLPHVPGLAVLEGRDIYVPDVFARAGQQPIITTPRFRPLDAYQINKPFEAASPEALAGFIDHARRLLAEAGSRDPMFVLLLYPERFGFAPPSGTRPVAAGPHALLLAVPGTTP